MSHKAQPFYAQWIFDRYDLFPKGFSESEIVDTLNNLSRTRFEYDLLLETASFEDVDAYYNPGEDPVSDEFILEAIVVDKFSRTERRMAAVVRTFNSHLKTSANCW
ncbi:MAG: hypothetical protein IJU76_05375 [Desulfovibrionaceae bacterium]|nr:hypothetical protein [Desulfovibrionaceae bacterium]